MERRKQLSLFIFLIAIASFLSFGMKGPGKKPREITIAFYNLENLFDTKDDPETNDQEFLPDGSYEWTEEHYQTKLGNMARVISQLGDEDGPEILGVCEVENREVLEDLVAHPLLKKHKYKVAHHDSPDQRGIDCALLYKEKVFSPLYQRDFEVKFPENPDIKTRDIFMVKGIIDKSQEITLVVNHWPSRRGGKEDSEWKRVRAASTLRTVLDSIFELDKFARLVIMGDFNDEPSDTSLFSVLGGSLIPGAAVRTGLYNTLSPSFQEGKEGTLMYNKQWDWFDQILISHYLNDTTGGVSFIPGSAGIYRPEWMQVPEGDWKGAPKRTHIRRQFYEDGFSDHFPVYLKLKYQK